MLLRLVGVGQMLTVSVLAESIEMHRSDHEAQEFDFLGVEQALLGFRVQVIFAQLLQDTLDMNFVIYPGSLRKMRISLR